MGKSTQYSLKQRGRESPAEEERLFFNVKRAKLFYQKTASFEKFFNAQAKGKQVRYKIRPWISCLLQPHERATVAFSHSDMSIHKLFNGARNDGVVQVAPTKVFFILGRSIYCKHVVDIFWARKNISIFCWLEVKKPKSYFANRPVSIVFLNQTTSMEKKCIPFLM